MSLPRHHKLIFNNDLDASVKLYPTMVMNLLARNIYGWARRGQGAKSLVNVSNILRSNYPCHSGVSSAPVTLSLASCRQTIAIESSATMSVMVKNLSQFITWDKCCHFRAQRKDSVEYRQAISSDVP